MNNDRLTAKIISFLHEIGLETKASPIDEPTVLPGIAIKNGAIVIDESKLQHPGDLLHEAGHLAVMTSDRRKFDDCVGKKAYEEMAAIAWSYAASVYLQLEPSVVFHPAGYKGGSESLIDNFTNGRYFGTPILQWLGLTNEPKQDLAPETVVYPQMIKWLVD